MAVDVSDKNGELDAGNGDQGSKYDVGQAQVTAATTNRGENQLTGCQITESLWIPSKKLIY